MIKHAKIHKLQAGKQYKMTMRILDYQYEHSQCTPKAVRKSMYIHKLVLPNLPINSDEKTSMHELHTLTPGTTFSRMKLRKQSQVTRRLV
uniref:Uncharacterized protein n=1 Tax=Rhizophora mucronata TaxID=61149 RepID=A0A2P2N8D3_RHIMU